MRKRQGFLHRTEYFHEALLMKENYCRSDNFFLLLQRWIVDFSLLFFPSHSFAYNETPPNAYFEASVKTSGSQRGHRRFTTVFLTNK